mgnify:CR=1 FL=1
MFLQIADQVVRNVTEEGLKPGKERVVIASFHFTYKFTDIESRIRFLYIGIIRQQVFKKPSLTSKFGKPNVYNLKRLSYPLMVRYPL